MYTIYISICIADRIRNRLMINTMRGGPCMGMGHEPGHCKMAQRCDSSWFVTEKWFLVSKKTVTNPHQNIVLRGLTSTLESIHEF